MILVLRYLLIYALVATPSLRILQLGGTQVNGELPRVLPSDLRLLDVSFTGVMASDSKEIPWEYGNSNLQMLNLTGWNFNQVCGGKQTSS